MLFNSSKLKSTEFELHSPFFIPWACMFVCNSLYTCDCCDKQINHYRKYRKASRKNNKSFLLSENKIGEDWDSNIDFFYIDF